MEKPIKKGISIKGCQIFINNNNRMILEDKKGNQYDMKNGGTDPSKS